MQARKKNNLTRLVHLGIVLIEPIFNIKKLLLSIPSYLLFLKDLIGYSAMAKKGEISILDLQPALHDKKSKAGVGDESFYQNAWALRIIRENSPKEHVDVGSNTLFIAMLSGLMPVTAIDIRPFRANLDGLQFRRGDILNLPYEDRTVVSMSCLHTIEHVGLGRYGDRLNPEGSHKAIKELMRVLAPVSNLYVAVPVGRATVRFNYTRVFSPQYIIDEFRELDLIELSGIGPDKEFQRNIDINLLSSIEYGIGLFHFRKPVV